ncbi:hypothetical protein M5K25_008103 [Dendrobium thyrsiflorum]|uniref:Aminotransferase-like plant mobile domain-containing protein n=1 Tax=Dendrobium thyrsiflorum TaxID=117978 RepID=A0ABD0VEM0_DENTH
MCFSNKEDLKFALQGWSIINNVEYVVVSSNRKKMTVVCAQNGRHAGLVRGCREIFPNAAHRHCLRHLRENFKKAVRRMGVGDVEFLCQKMYMAGNTDDPMVFDRTEMLEGYLIDATSPFAPRVQALLRKIEQEARRLPQPIRINMHRSNWAQHNPASGTFPLLPPNFRRRSGRPRTNRIRNTMDEARGCMADTQDRGRRRHRRPSSVEPTTQPPVHTIHHSISLLAGSHRAAHPEEHPDPEVLCHDPFNPRITAKFKMGQAHAQTCIPLRWLRWTFWRDSYIDLSEMDFWRHVRAYILFMLGCHLLPDTSGSEIHLQYLPLMEDIAIFRTYSLGGAVLAHLYRELSEAIRPKRSKIAGCIHLLQIWAWEHLHVGRPQLHVPFPVQLDGLSVGLRWNEERVREVPIGNVFTYMDDLDGLLDSQAPVEAPTTYYPRSPTERHMREFIVDLERRFQPYFGGSEDSPLQVEVNILGDMCQRLHQQVYIDDPHYFDWTDAQQPVFTSPVPATDPYDAGPSSYPDLGPSQSQFRSELDIAPTPHFVPSSSSLGEHPVSHPDVSDQEERHLRTIPLRAPQHFTPGTDAIPHRLPTSGSTNCLQAIWAYSGHYKPSNENLNQFLNYLSENGIDLNEVEIRSASSEDYEETKKPEGEADDVVDAFSISKPPPLQIPPRSFIVPSEQPTKSSINSETENGKGNELKAYKRTLSGGLQSPKTDVSEKAIQERIKSKMKSSSYQLGHQVSFKWSTGAGPRIGCVADYPVELRLQALELTNLSPTWSRTPKQCS